MKKKTIGLIAVAAFVIVFLTGSQSYFNYKEINFATDKCLEIGGSPVVQSSFLALNFSFSCEK
ncbi:hypothetical protein D1B31_07360 [Neobacillus notoginsengisoli]|uniref:Uncharacterized protein n=1 Tax=Neobacillus notoginsengisoli TaxID=1578198 RepID=A0A417YVX0_9BACI|nr:hypothetical protein [Neobacillus notoginsengisoli]RHW41532.1 hypothetical protein D1B31_07360 [Neobacillus notoginsengisoli]